MQSFYRVLLSYLLALTGSSVGAFNLPHIISVKNFYHVPKLASVRNLKKVRNHPTITLEVNSSSALNAGLLNPVVLGASFSATAKLLSSIGLGALASPSGPKCFGRILDGNSVSALSKLTYWLFQPCFLFCGVASTLAKATSTSGSGLPTSALLLLPLAALLQISLGALASKIVTTKKLGIRPRFLGLDTNDDSGAADVKMCMTFSNSGPLPLLFSDSLFRQPVLSDVQALISFYLLVWSPMFWSLGDIILGVKKTDSLVNGENASIGRKVLKQVKSFLNPPVCGSLLGILIGSLGTLRSLFVNPGAPLSPIFSACRTFGAAYLPAAVLVLAGSLVKKQDSAGDKKSIHPKTILSLLVSKFILSPILAVTTLRLLGICGLLPVNNARTLAVVSFTLLMEGCMPPAQNSVIMLQLAQEQERAGKMAKLLTVMYALSAIPVTLLLSGCLEMSGILKFALQ